MRKILSVILVGILIITGTGCQNKKLDLDITENDKPKELIENFDENDIVLPEPVVDKNKDVPTAEFVEETLLVLDNDQENENIVPEESDEIEDRSGDYIGNVLSQTPVQTCSFVANGDKENHNDAFTLYTEKIDDGNFRFYIMKAKFVGGEGSLKDMTEEALYFKEHIAHYNGDGFYEYIGKTYHIYFRYLEDPELGAANSVMEVYGLNDIIDKEHFGGIATYNDMVGIIFIEGIPFAG